ncbi:helix-turn-helix domain-containing protein [Streptomyces sp. NPDC057621]|uniref:helix-turn-helix domain-containing protein n=1 Tax=Streptomyces sp. NPDC057621 TaxID=3346186 RepID=UPI0036973ADA
MKPGSIQPAPASSPAVVSRYQVMRRLTRAASHSDAELLAEAATLAQGSAVLVNLTGDVVCSTPATAGPEGARAAAYPQLHPHLTIRKMAGGVLVIRPGAAAPASRTDVIARTTVDLLRTRARIHRAEDTHHTEQRLHTAVVRLLLGGQPKLATDVLGDTAHTHTTVFRLLGPTAHAAYQAYWRTAQPSLSPTNPRLLVHAEGNELAVIALHSLTHDPRAARTLVADIANRHQLAAGASDPAPLDMTATAWTEAGNARHRATAGALASTATSLGPHGLLHTVPADRLTTWATAILTPLNRAQHRTLEAYLRSGSAHTTAAVLGTSEGTVRTRLRAISTRLAAELDHPTIQAQLLLALRAPTTPTGADLSARLGPEPPIPAELLDPDDAQRWASALLKPLDQPLRIALRCWLNHRGRTAPAATELGLSRSTLTHWLNRCGQTLSLDLTTATVRTELHLAIETTATPHDTPAQLPRRGGRTYRGA